MAHAELKVAAEKSRKVESVSAMASSDQLNEGRNGDEEKSRPGGGCGRNCLSRCCLLRGSRLSLYRFSKVERDSRSSLNFLERLFKEWDYCRVRGLFHHDISAYENKILPGRYGFIAQLIEGRDLKKRPTEFRIDKVLQPFDGDKFNFTKIGQEEVLLRFEESVNDGTGFFHNAPVTASESPNIIAINVSPIGYGHVLLIPCVLDCLPQRLDEHSFLLAVYMAREAQTPYFRVGYNSLGAFATINHLHFQAFYMMETFPVEKASTQSIATLTNGVEIYQLTDYPVRGLVFEGGDNLEDLSITVSRACIFIQDNEIPYNVLISDSGKRVFILLQCFAEKRARGEIQQEIIEMQINPAAWELSGYVVMKRRKDYQEASEDTVRSFLCETSVPAERFEDTKKCILETLYEKTA